MVLIPTFASEMSGVLSKNCSRAVFATGSKGSEIGGLKELVSYVCTISFRVRMISYTLLRGGGGVYLLPPL